MNDLWGIYRYEVMMRTELLQLWRDHREYIDALKFPIPNAVTESIVLHTRILVGILLSRGKQPDDINLARLLPGFTCEALKTLEQAYGDSGKNNSPCWAFNKMLAHATTLRSHGYDYTPHLDSLYPAIDVAIRKIDKERSSRSSR